eukprot:6488965-Amphidinium_carterae.2
MENFLSQRQHDDLFIYDDRPGIWEAIHQLQQRVWGIAINRAYAPWSPPQSQLGNRSPNVFSPLHNSRPGTPLEGEGQPRQVNPWQRATSYGGSTLAEFGSRQSWSSFASRDLLLELQEAAKLIGSYRDFPQTACLIENQVYPDDVELYLEFCHGVIQNEFSLRDLEKDFLDLQLQEFLFNDDRATWGKREPYYEDEYERENA